METHSDNKPYLTPYSYQRHGQVINNEDELHVSIWHAKDNELLGFAILAGLSNPNQVLECRRIVINKKGQGFGHETIQLLKKYCFEELKYHKFWLDALEGNQRAIHLYEVEGFKKEGILREHVKKETGHHSLILFSMLASEYTPTSV
ncbi:GNAT family protein [uncultured Microscilla sp.]|uniref:GNAT family N-acetyltransferase n=1 Tax=uncultured Microscilla sp. TaxID=432653 RepID=UPI0026017260|nr:GNAT family protein [uncultured Microscilla sp.]